MTERLDRIETLLGSLAERQDRFQQQMEESDRQFRAQLEESDRGFRERMEASDRTLRESINDTVSMISELAQQHEQRSEESRQRREELQAEQAEFRQQHAEFKQRHEEYKREQQEFGVRFENLLNDARADRQLNEQEHRAFRETFQTLLAEISRIWRRLAG